MAERNSTLLNLKTPVRIRFFRFLRGIFPEVSKNAMCLDRITEHSGTYGKKGWYLNMQANKLQAETKTSAQETYLRSRETKWPPLDELYPAAVLGL